MLADTPARNTCPPRAASDSPFPSISIAHYYYRNHKLTKKNARVSFSGWCMTVHLQVNNYEQRKKTKSFKHNGLLKGFIIVFNIIDIKNVETIL